MKLVPVHDAAREVGRSRATIFAHMAAGRLKRYRRPGVDRRTFCDLDALRELLGGPPAEEPPGEAEEHNHV